MREVLRKIRGTDNKYCERNPEEVEEDLKNIHYHVHHCMGTEDQGQMAVSISMGLR